MPAGLEPGSATDRPAPRRRGPGAPGHQTRCRRQPRAGLAEFPVPPLAWRSRSHRSWQARPGKATPERDSSRYHRPMRACPLRFARRLVPQPARVDLCRAWPWLRSRCTEPPPDVRSGNSRPCAEIRELDRSSRGQQVLHEVAFLLELGDGRGDLALRELVERDVLDDLERAVALGMKRERADQPLRYAVAAVTHDRR